MRTYLKVDKKNRITLPNQCNISPGDHLEFEVLRLGQIILTPIVFVKKEFIMLRIITNNQPRPILEFLEIPVKVRDMEFNYHYPDDVGAFFRYKNWYYDISQFIPLNKKTDPSPFKEWDMIQSETFFSGILIKFTNDNNSVIIGRYYE